MSVPNFKKPAERNAAVTLIMMGTILGAMFIGISLLAYWNGITPNPKETVVSQIAAATLGRGVLYTHSGHYGAHPVPGCEYRLFRLSAPCFHAG